jgi:hypothetical protein
MKADLRISVKDSRRSKSLKVHLAQVNFSQCPEFFVRMNGQPWLSDGRPVSITKVFAALRQAVVKSMTLMPPG